MKEFEACRSCPWPYMCEPKGECEADDLDFNPEPEVDPDAEPDDMDFDLHEIDEDDVEEF